MRKKFQPSSIHVARKRIGALFLMLLLFALPLTTYAANQAANQTSSTATALKGQLSPGYNPHYLAVKPTQRDGAVTLTLHIDPKLSLQAASRVNLWVLSPDGLRKFQKGEKPEQLAIAAGNPTVLDADADAEEIYNKEATFKTSGPETYTVIVYSHAAVAVNYTLVADNGVLLDASGQTEVIEETSSADQAEDEATNPVKPTDTPTPQAQPTATATSQPEVTSARPATSTPTAQPQSEDEGGDESGGDE